MHTYNYADIKNGRRYELSDEQKSKLCQSFSLNLGRTGRMRFPKEESCVMKYPTELALAC